MGRGSTSQTSGIRGGSSDSSGSPPPHAESSKHAMNANRVKIDVAMVHGPFVDCGQRPAGATNTVLASSL